MALRPAPAGQMDLLAWQPPQAVRRFEEPRVRAGTFRERMTRAVAAALLHATRDQRLLELLAEPMGWAVVDRKFLPLIELGALREKAAQLEKRAKELAHQVARDGVL